jgi:hypothetical protein
MFELLDFSKIINSFNLSKIVNTIFTDNYNFLKNIYDNISSKVTISIGNSVTGLINPTPEMSEYVSRMALRSLVDLSPIGMTIADENAIRKLKGSISWFSAEKMDVTETIREIRDC